MPQPERFHWLRHAFVGRDSTSPPNELDTEWVGLFRETEADGTVHYGVEHLDKDFNEICPDDLFSAEAEAQARAEAEYAVRPEDWREGRRETPTAASAEGSAKCESLASSSGRAERPHTQPQAGHS